MWSWYHWMSNKHKGVHYNVTRISLHRDCSLEDQSHVVPCVCKVKINQILLPIIHRQSFNPLSIRHTLIIIRRRYRKGNISVTVCHRQVFDGNQWKALSTNSVKDKTVFENIISHWMAGCYMLVEENRHRIAFMLWKRSAGEVVSMRLCLCVIPGMKGYRWACTDKHMGRPIASGNQKPWFTTRRWSDTHSSVWELDKHCWSAHACACTNTHTLHSQEHK